MKCKICGTNGKPGTEYCPNCGYRLIRPEQASVAPSSGTAQPGYTAPTDAWDSPSASVNAQKTPEKRDAWEEQPAEASPAASVPDSPGAPMLPTPPWNRNGQKASRPVRLVSFGIIILLLLGLIGSLARNSTPDISSIWPDDAYEDYPDYAEQGVLREGVRVNVDDYAAESFALRTFDQPVVWQDPAFERMIRLALDRTQGDIYPPELAWITALHVVGDGYVGINTEFDAYDDYNRGDIRTLDDLRWFSALDEVYIDYQDLTDISGLSGFEEMTRLSLESNGLTDISVLAALRGLEMLWLADNEIEDVSALSGMDWLYGVSLADNRISDLTPLAELPCLEIVDVEGNPVTDLSPLAHIEELYADDWGE